MLANQRALNHVNHFFSTYMRKGPRDISRVIRAIRGHEHYSRLKRWVRYEFDTINVSSLTPKTKKWIRHWWRFYFAGDIRPHVPDKSDVPIEKFMQIKRHYQLQKAARRLEQHLRQHFPAKTFVYPLDEDGAAVYTCSQCQGTEFTLYVLDYYTNMKNWKNWKREYHQPDCPGVQSFERALRDVREIASRSICRHLNSITIQGLCAIPDGIDQNILSFLWRSNDFDTNLRRYQ
jgi:hypothetical protein